MPNIDVGKIALIVLLVGSVVGLAAWFVVAIYPTIVLTGEAATSALGQGGGGAWQSIVTIFGPFWNTAWDLGLSIVGVLMGAAFIYRVIKWVV